METPTDRNGATNVSRTNASHYPPMKFCRDRHVHVDRILRAGRGLATRPATTPIAPTPPGTVVLRHDRECPAALDGRSGGTRGACLCGTR